MSDSPRHERLSDRTEQELLRRIHSGELSVGTRLPSEPELAEQMGVSRGILREALSSLQMKGYITRTPRGGSFIQRATDDDIGRSISAQVRSADMQDLMEFREAMETRGVQFVIDRATDEELAALRALLEEPDEGKQETIDYYFHYRLAELTGNHLFVVFVDMYYDAIRRFAQGSYRDSARKRVMMREHMRIMEALEKRDKRAAVTAVKGHLHNALLRASGDWNVYI